MVPPMALEPPIDIDDLIAQLYLEAGRIMEDTSVEFALTLPATIQQRKAHLDRLSQAAAEIVALADAAQTLHRRTGQD